MEKTLCYEVIFREQGFLYDEGFIIVEIKDGRLKNIEGMLTVDYIKSSIRDGIVTLGIYSLENNSLDEIYSFKEREDNIEFPIFLCEEYEGIFYEFQTCFDIKNKYKENKQELQKIKRKYYNVFKSER